MYFIFRHCMTESTSDQTKESADKKPSPELVVTGTQPIQEIGSKPLESQTDLEYADSYLDISGMV